MADEPPPKSMSSRLLTMKFMQRAAISPSTPSTISPSTLQSREHQSKRRKLSQASSANIPAEPVIDQEAIQAALAEGERKRQQALVKQAAELGDARWVLDLPDDQPNAATSLNIVQVGYAQIDKSDESASFIEYDSVVPIRRYNWDKRKVRVSKAAGSDDGSNEDDEDTTASHSSDSSEDEARHKPYGQSPESAMLSGRSSPSTKADSYRSSKKSAENALAKELAEKRRKKDVRLNPSKKLTSISSGGTSSLNARPPTFTCNRCGKPGHKAAQCHHGSKVTRS